MKKPRPPFDPNAFLLKVAGGKTLSSYRKDQIVFSQGAPADAVFYIQKGKVKITVISEHGKEAVVALLGTGDVCGEGCLAGQPLRISTASAMCGVRATPIGENRHHSHASRRTGVFRDVPLLC